MGLKFKCFPARNLMNGQTRILLFSNFFGTFTGCKSQLIAIFDCDLAITLGISQIHGNLTFIQIYTNPS
jgi:hypothetical protein